MYNTSIEPTCFPAVSTTKIRFGALSHSSRVTLAKLHGNTVKRQLTISTTGSVHHINMLSYRTGPEYIQVHFRFSTEGLAFLEHQIFILISDFSGLHKFGQYDAKLTYIYQWYINGNISMIYKWKKWIVQLSIRPEFQWKIAKCISLIWQIQHSIPDSEVGFSYGSISVDLICLDFTKMYFPILLSLLTPKQGCKPGSYISSKLCCPIDQVSDRVTGVKSRAKSVKLKEKVFI